MIYLLVTIFLFFVVNKCIGLYDIFNPFISFFLYHIFFLFIALSWADYFALVKGTNIAQETKNYILYSILIFTFSGLFSHFILSKLVKGVNTKIQFYNYVFYKNSSNKILVSYVFLSLGVLFFIFFIIKAKEIPIFAEDAENFRIKAREGMGYVTILSITLVTYSSLYILLSQKHGFLFKLTLFFVSGFVLLSFGNRAPFLVFAAFYFVLYSMVNRVRLNFYKVLPVIVFLYLLLVFIGAYRMNAEVSLLAKVGLTIGWRPFVNISNINIIFNEYKQFLYGLGYWIDLYVLMPGYSPNLGTWVKEVLGLEFDGGSVTITYLGEAFVNFGLIGVLFYPIVMSILLTLMNFAFKTMVLKGGRKLYLDQAILFLMISFNLGGIVSSGITSIVLYNIAPAVCTYIFHNLLSSIKLKE